MTTNTRKPSQFVYRELEKQTAYEQCGGNYLHKQEEDGQPTESWSQWNIGLDGLYMAEPFLMECANAIDEGKIRLIGQDGEEVASAAIYEEAYARMAWVASAMLDSETGPVPSRLECREHGRQRSFLGTGYWLVCYGSGRYH